MTKTQQNPTTIPTKTNKAALIREMLAQGKDSKEIAAEVGCLVQYVYGVRNYERTKAKKAQAKAKYERKKAIVAGAVKRKYTKKSTVDKRTMLELDRNRLKDMVFDLSETNEQLIKQIQEATKPKIQYIEVEVPQPFSHFTFWQRLRILFLGRSA